MYQAAIQGSVGEYPLDQEETISGQRPVHTKTAAQASPLLFWRRTGLES